MPRSKAHELQVVAVHGDGEPAGRVSPLSSPCDDLNQQIIRLLQEDGRAAYDVIAHVEVMTRLGMFKNQFLLKHHVP